VESLYILIQLTNIQNNSDLCWAILFSSGAVQICSFRDVRKNMLLYYVTDSASKVLGDYLFPW